GGAVVAHQQGAAGVVAGDRDGSTEEALRGGRRVAAAVPGERDRLGVGGGRCGTGGRDGGGRRRRGRSGGRADQGGGKGWCCGAGRVQESGAHRVRLLSRAEGLVGEGELVVGLLGRVQRGGHVSGPGVGVRHDGAGRVGAGGGHLVGVAALVREGAQRGDQAPVLGGGGLGVGVAAAHGRGAEAV